VKDVTQLLRDALPEIIAGLVVAAILSIIGLLYTQAGLWSIALAVVGAIILALALWFIVSRHKKSRIQKGGRPTIDRITQQYQSNSVGKESILFVDDDIELIGHGFIVPLIAEGFHVLTATNVSQAVQILQSDQRLDLVITDLIMPYGDEKPRAAQFGGLDVIEMARKLRGNIPIICLSVVHNEKEIPRRLQELGVTEHLLKPILPSEFLQRVKLALLLSKKEPQENLIADEIKSRTLELRSSWAYTRVRALWALGELGHYEPTILELLESIAQTDDDSDVRAAATEAIGKIETRIQKQGN